MARKPFARRARGRTRPGRLRALDEYLCRYERLLLERAGPEPFLDVGVGERPDTTLEAAQAFRALRPDLRVVGIDVEPRRVEAAQRFADERTRFVSGDFEVARQAGPARLIRAMNVLRGYPIELVAPAHQTLGSALRDGGLLVEGSSDVDGGILSAHLLRRRAESLVREALLFHTRFADGGFAPIRFRDWLPRDLRRAVVPGEPVHAFFSRWTGAWQAVRGAHREDPRAAFRATAERLAESGEEVVRDEWLFEHGYLVWRPQGGVPRARAS